MAKEKITQIWPEWEVEKQLGRGSYGVVYQAVRRDSNIQSRAAIKVISIPADSSELDSLRSEGLTMDGAKTYFKRIVNDFVDEIRLMEKLKGVQNIVSVEDYKVVERTDEIGWDIYIRMELLTPFNTYLCDRQLTEKDVIKLGVDICTALEICSKCNIVHRDIKPENIFINDFGFFKLGDFGIARKLENATGGLSQKGTFNYMAPEVASGSNYDARVDIYSLGIVLYRLLNQNRLPFIENEQQLLNPNARKAAMERRIQGERIPAPCTASPQVAAVILRACAFNPSQRFLNATSMKEALQQAAEGKYREPVIAPTHAAVNDPDRTVSVRPTGNVGVAPGSVAPQPGRYHTPQQPVNYNTTNTNRPMPAYDPNSNSNRSVGNVYGNRTAPVNVLQNAPVQKQAVAVKPKDKRKLNKMCLFALISCLLPVLTVLLLKSIIVGEMYDLCSLFALPIAFLPPFLAVLGRAETKRTNTKGNALALIALFAGLLTIIGVAENGFNGLAYNGYIPDGMSIGLQVTIAVLALLIFALPYLRASKKDKKQ